MQLLQLLLKQNKMRHELKTLVGVFNDIKTGKKTFDIRRNDRDFKKGDILDLKEYNRNTGEYTGDFVVVEVTYIFYANVEITNGLLPGYCVMGIKFSQNE